MGVEAALFAFAVGHRVVANDPVTGTDRAERSEALAPSKRHAIDAQALLAVLVDKQARRAIAKRRIDVVLPQIQRLEDMPVSIDDVVSATHTQLLSGE